MCGTNDDETHCLGLSKTTSSLDVVDVQYKNLFFEPLASKAVQIASMRLDSNLDAVVEF